ncbi:hypothetical protein HAX54_019718 [Datura stramonium]|uniref:F-box domain-containing protein n=1 Tax=Datura stramonium TaxID=4076 RepID=A0ABS8UQX8_DATST|nr:hypothetical protein [Datura stramonium]
MNASNLLLLIIRATTALIVLVNLAFVHSENMLKSQNLLSKSEMIQLKGAVGPESVAFHPNGQGPYTGVADGRILKWKGSSWADFAVTSSHRKNCTLPFAPEMEHICGRPLGLRFDTKTGELYIADAYFGLQVVGPNGGLATPLVQKFQGAWWFMMTPKGRNHCRSLLPDILSDLPNNLIDVILMHLSCKDAVRTSVLSKEWRKIIYQILTLHEGPITKFTLNVGHLENCPEIDNFISFLSRNGIEQLVLWFRWGKRYSLPSSFFTCSQLRHLNLHCCSIHLPSAFQGFDHLISLELCEVTISSELLKSLISRCPLLEQLVLENSEDLGTIEINAPILRSFDFTGDISSICLKNVPHLVKVTLLGDCLQAEDLDFAKVFESCSALEHLSFDFFNFGFFAVDGYEAPTMLPFNLNSVKRFYLPDILLVESYKLSYALCLIRSFPYLEYLEIQVHYQDDSDTDEESTEESLELKCLSDVTFNHLREVKLEYFSRRTSEMQFIKLLLANSQVLERMLIDGRFLDQEALDRGLEIFAEGGAHPEISCFEDPWTKEPLKFENSYFVQD